MDAVREIRLDGIHLSTLSDVFRKQLLDNPIVDMLLEMGGTMNTFFYVYRNTWTDPYQQKNPAYLTQ